MSNEPRSVSIADLDKMKNNPTLHGMKQVHWPLWKRALSSVTFVGILILNILLAVTVGIPLLIVGICHSLILRGLMAVGLIKPKPIHSFLGSMNKSRGSVRASLFHLQAVRFKAPPKLSD